MPTSKNSVETVRTSLQIDEALPQHEKGWIVQRVGWVVILGIVLAGLLGIFGEGILSKREPVAGGIKASYERFYRFEAEMKIVVESSVGHISNISFPQQYIRNFKIIRFVPQPENNMTSATDVIYNFLPSQNRVVSIYLTPTSRGAIEGNMKINGVNNFQLHHFIYP